MKTVKQSVKQLVRALADSVAGGLEIGLSLSSPDHEVECVAIRKAGINDWHCTCGANSGNPCAHMKALWLGRFEDDDVLKIVFVGARNQVARKVHEIDSARKLPWKGHN